MATSLFSQGTIRGTIYDEGTGETVPFVNILVVETQTGTTTDLDGAYSLSLNEGSYSIEFSFLGYSTLTVSEVVVKNGEVALLDVNLKEESEVLEEIVVTATQVRNTEAALLTIQRKSPNLLDGISSQTFKKIGDSDAASAISRVTGVSVQGGKYVFVRGLGDRYTKSILNGMDIPGLDPDRNTLQMDIFPTNLIDNIIVVKSFTPDLPGDFTGGVVDIITKDFPEVKSGNISAGIGYNPSMHFKSQALTYPGSPTDALGFDSGDRDLPFYKGIIIPAPAERSSELTRITGLFSNNWAAQRQSNRPDLNFSFSGGNQINKSKVNLGYNYALNYRNTNDYFNDVEYNIFLKPASTETFSLDANRIQKGELASNNVLLTAMVGGALKYKNHKVSLSLLRINNGESKAGFFNQESFISAVNTIQRDNLEYSERSISNALLKGRHVFDDGGLEVDWKLSPTYSAIADKDVRAAPFRTETTDGVTTYAIEPSEGAAPIRIYRDLQEVNYSGKVDVTKNLSLNGKDAKIKVGVSEVLKNRDYSILNYQFDIQRADNITFTGDANEILQPSNIWTPETRTGVYVFGNPEPANTFEATQSTLGTYLMAELPLSDKLKFIGGVRAENFIHKYTGQNNTGSVVYNDEELLNNWSFLPGANFVYAVDDMTNLRASFSQTVARPSFKELSLAQIYDAITDRFFIGNSQLVQTDIRNYDLRIEKYMSGGQMIALSGFYKGFENPIEVVAFSDAAPEDVTPRNVGNAKVFGIELEIRKNLGFVAPSLSPLTIGTNITVVNSSVEMDQSAGGEYESRLRSARVGEEITNTRQMQGQSPYIVNAFLGYTLPESGIEANLSYNVQGKRLAVVGIASNPDVYEQPFHSMNLKVSKSMGQDGRTSISIAAQNLLNAKRLLEYESFGTDNQVYSKFVPNRSFSFSVGYKIY
jgi:outer membrane receptor for ferrienterochelin and colicin